MPKAIEMMKTREQEIRAALLHLSEQSQGFTKPRIVVIGGYALRASIPLSRFTMFAARKPTPLWRWKEPQRDSSWEP